MATPNQRGTSDPPRVLVGASTPAVDDQPCARCGGHAPYDFGALWLCLHCYHVAGSTCAGIRGPEPETATTC